MRHAGMFAIVAVLLHGGPCDPCRCSWCLSGACGPRLIVHAGSCVVSHRPGIVRLTPDHTATWAVVLRRVVIQFVDQPRLTDDRSRSSLILHAGGSWGIPSTA